MTDFNRVAELAGEIALAKSNGNTEDADRMAREFRRLVGSQEEDKAAYKLEILNMADVEEREVPWLWRPYVPLGELVAIQGPPGQGKSTIATALAAAVTTGGFMPHESGDGYVPVPAGDVLWFSIEDHPEYVLAKRLRLMGADPARFHVVQGKVAEDEEGAVRTSVSLQDLPLIREAVERIRPKLFTMDPFQAYLGPGKSMNAAEDTRPLLDGILDVLREYDAAGLLVRHQSKGQMRSLLDTGMGSGDIAGACRSILAVGSRTDDPQADRGMLHVKSNVGPEGGALGYRIGAEGAFEWTGRTDITRADLMGKGRSDKPTAQSRAVEFVEDFLTAGPQKSRALTQAALGAGLSETHVTRARSRLGCCRGKVGSEWWVSLPPGPQDWAKAVKAVNLPRDTD